MEGTVERSGWEGRWSTGGVGFRADETGLRRTRAIV